MTFHQFDYSAVADSPSLGQRLRAVAGSPRLIIGGTLGVLIVLAGVVPLGVLLVLAAKPDYSVGWTGPAFFLALTGMGLYVCYDVVAQAGDYAGLARFAKDNDLLLTTGEPGNGYAGSRFRDRDHVVERSVRTRGEDFVEVGDSFTLEAVTLRDVRAVHDQRGTVRARTPQAFLRARLAGGSSHPPQEGVQVSPALYDDLHELLGPHSVEITRTELTVFGSAPLGLGDRDRLREAFRLVAALVGENACDLPADLDTVRSTRRPRRNRPWVVVLGTLVLVIGVPLAFAGVMSEVVPVGGVPGGKGAVIGLGAVAVLVAVASLGMRSMMIGRRSRAAEVYARHGQ